MFPIILFSSKRHANRFYTLSIFSLCISIHIVAQQVASFVYSIIEIDRPMMQIKTNWFTKFSSSSTSSNKKKTKVIILNYNILLNSIVLNNTKIDGGIIIIHHVESFFLILN